MARKGKNKRKQRKYSKRQFVEIVCSNCNMCANKGDPIFCYNSIYKINPKRFGTVLGNLMRISKHYKDSDLSASDIGIEQFSDTFCHTGVCSNSFSAFCPLLPDCHEIFSAQVEDKEKSIPLKHKVTKFIQKSKGRKRARYVCHAYPTFFSSNNDKFKATIERILHGDNIIKQDNDKKSADEAEELSCGKTQSKKS